jgi:arginine decarboxylase
VEALRDAGMGDCLKLLHFHMGSQIQRARHRRRHARGDALFRRAVELGAKISHVDVGGGLGIDYEGTRSRSYNSVNYGIHHYAVQHRAAAGRGLRGEGLPPPRIVTECGRAMTAHHAVLVANVSEVEQAPEGRVPEPHDDESQPVRHLRELHGEWPGARRWKCSTRPRRRMPKA